MKYMTAVLLSLAYFGAAIVSLAVLAAHEEQYSGPAGREFAAEQLELPERMAVASSYVVGFPLSLPFWLAGSPHGFFWLTAIPNALILAWLISWLCSRRRAPA